MFFISVKTSLWCFINVLQHFNGRLEPENNSISGSLLCLFWSLVQVSLLDHSSPFSMLLTYRLEWYSRNPQLVQVFFLFSVKHLVLQRQCLAAGTLKSLYLYSTPTLPKLQLWGFLPRLPIWQFFSKPNLQWGFNHFDFIWFTPIFFTMFLLLFPCIFFAPFVS